MDCSTTTWRNVEVIHLSESHPGNKCRMLYAQKLKLTFIINISKHAKIVGFIQIIWKFSRLSKSEIYSGIQNVCRTKPDENQKTWEYFQAFESVSSFNKHTNYCCGSTSKFCISFIQTIIATYSVGWISNFHLSFFHFFPSNIQ